MTARTAIAIAPLQPLREYLRNNITHLRSSPCLIISSAPPPLPPSSGSTSVLAGPSSLSSSSASAAAISSFDHEQRRQFKLQAEKIHSFIQRNTQTLALEYNLKTIPCHVSSAFPTLSSVEEAVSLAMRAGLKSGEGVVIGLGTGAAIDLAKAVADTLFESNISCYQSSSTSHDGEGNKNDAGGTLVLSPCTLGGLWAASSNFPSILLDTKEEALFPHRTPSWREMMNRDAPAIRKGTVVTMDPLRYWAMPPLYAPFRPAKRSDYNSSLPPMAHVAAAALAILLDVARLIDSVGFGVEKTNLDAKLQQEQQRMIMDTMKEVASSCASVLVLATHEAKSERNEERIALAQRHLLDSIPRLSSVLEHSPRLSPKLPLITISSGTIPHKLANALLPTYFPQCHYITYLASTLTGLCDMLSESQSSSSLNGAESMVGMIAASILESSNEIDRTMRISSLKESSTSLSSWASQVSAAAGLPSMASLAYGTPDLNALVNSLDSYAALMGTEDGDIIGSSRQDDDWVMEDILRRGLHR
jgi:hypothetical protein